MSNSNETSKSFKLLISSCLLGDRVRYDGKINKLESELIDDWLLKGWLLKVCPEVCGGLPTPRAAAEIQFDGSIKTKSEDDVTDAFKAGAKHTLALALQHNIKIAILTEKSPSCGSSIIYNGRFDNTLITGQGVTTQLLRSHGIEVFNQFELHKVQALLAG